MKDFSALRFFLGSLFLIPIFLLVGFFHFLRRIYIDIFLKSKKLQTMRFLKENLEKEVYPFLENNKFKKKDKNRIFCIYEKMDLNYLYEVTFQFEKGDFPELRV